MAARETKGASADANTPAAALATPTSKKRKHVNPYAIKRKRTMTGFGPNSIKKSFGGLRIGNRCGVGVGAKYHPQQQQQQHQEQQQQQQQQQQHNTNPIDKSRASATADACEKQAVATEDEDNTSTTTNTTMRTEGTAAAASVVSSIPGTQPEEEETVGAEPQPQHEGKGKIEADKDEQADQTSIGQVPIDQRLPSRTVSFGSAEILTVSELVGSASLFVDKSVRVSGVILNRCVMNDDASVCLVLGDPLRGDRPDPTLRTPRKAFPVSSRRIVTPHFSQARKPPVQPNQSTPETSKALTTTTVTPGTRDMVRTATTNNNIHDMNTNPHATITPQRSPLLPSKTSTKIGFYRRIPKAPGGLASSSAAAATATTTTATTTTTTMMMTPRTSKPLLGQKRKLQSLRSPTQLENGIRTMQQNSTSAMLVVLESIQIEAIKCNVRDLVMVLGEVRAYTQPDEDELQRQNAAGTNGCLGGTFLSKQFQRNHQLPVFFVRPRIVRNVNGTNLHLQQQMLELRRKHMQERHGEEGGSGCGPPRPTCKAATKEQDRPKEC